MIRKRYELVIENRAVLQIRPKQDKVQLKTTSMYGGWTDLISLDREHILELRDTLDQILMDWFCGVEEPRNKCATTGCGNQKMADSLFCEACRELVLVSAGKPPGPIKLNPTQVATLDASTFKPVTEEDSETRIGVDCDLCGGEIFGSFFTRAGRKESLCRTCYEDDKLLDDPGIEYVKNAIERPVGLGMDEDEIEELRRTT